METLWFYYWGAPTMHCNEHVTFGYGSMGAAQLRADGFCSVRASRFQGTLVTKPFVWPGGTLLVNALALGGGGHGGVKAEVLTEALSPAAGLGKEEADVFRGDGTRLVQSWRGRPQAIDGITGQRIRLRFHVDYADLFSFRSSLKDQCA